MTRPRAPTPPRCWHRRGHLIVAFADRRWRWADSGRFLRYGSNPEDPDCARCGRPPNADGSDACIGHVPGATSTCCGHGVEEGHVTFPLLGRVLLPQPQVPQLGIHGDLIEEARRAEADVAAQRELSVAIRTLGSAEQRRRVEEVHGCLRAAFRLSPLGLDGVRGAGWALASAASYPGRYRVVVAETDTARIVAVAIAHVPPREPPARVELTGIDRADLGDCGQLEWLGVHPGSRRRGLGETLIDAAAEATGAEALWLEVGRANDRARAFYAARGWRQIGIDGTSYYLHRRF